jgi:hypothetical protein
MSDGEPCAATRALEVLERIRRAVPRPPAPLIDSLSTENSMLRGTPARER